MDDLPRLPYRIIEELSDAVAVLDGDGTVLHANRAFAMLYNPFNDPEKKMPCRELQDLNLKMRQSEKRYASERLLVAPIGKKYEVFVCSLGGSDEENALSIVLVKSGGEGKEPEFTTAAELAGSYINEQRILSEDLGPAFNELKGDDLGFKIALINAQKAARTDLAILIAGESGTGKEMLARAVHRASSRKKEPFVDVNCAAIPENLIESELFGYERGAFTGARREGKRGLFEEAHHGTIFLDEVGDTSPSAQSKLLRILQEGRFKRVGGTKNMIVDVRIISATNRELKPMVHEKHFRDDLYYRLNTLSITLPSLRDRKSDIRLLAELFLKKNTSGRDARLSFSEEALRLMDSYGWPGNIRELKGVVDYAATMREHDVIGVESLPPSLFLEGPFSQKEKKFPTQTYSVNMSTRLLPSIIQKVEKDIIEMAIRQSDTKSQAINRLGISRRTFYNKIRQYNLEMDSEN